MGGGGFQFCMRSHMRADLLEIIDGQHLVFVGKQVKNCGELS